MVVNTFESLQNVGEPSNQFRREVLIKKDPHCLPMAVGRVSHVCREGVYGCEVFFLEARMLIENILFGHAVGQPAKNIIHCDPHPANTGFPVALISFDRDARVNWRHRINSLSRMFSIRVNSPVPNRPDPLEWY